MASTTALRRRAQAAACCLDVTGLCQAWVSQTYLLVVKYTG